MSRRTGLGLLLVAALLVAMFAAGVLWQVRREADAKTSRPAVYQSGVVTVYGYIGEPRGADAIAQPGERLPIYLWLYNGSAQDDALVAADSPVSETITPSDGELPAAMPARDWLSFEPGGELLTLGPLDEPVRAGDAVAVTLQFERNPPIDAYLIALERASASTPPPSSGALSLP